MWYVNILASNQEVPSVLTHRLAETVGVREQILSTRVPGRGAKARQHVYPPRHDMYLHSHRLGTCVTGEVGTGQHGPQASFSS